MGIGKTLPHRIGKKGKSNQFLNWHKHPSRGAFFVYNNNMRNIQLTESEETALVQMAMFFTDLGTPDEIDSEAFESLTDKIFEPSPFDYS